jgi:hypothetical protein
VLCIEFGLDEEVGGFVVEVVEIAGNQIGTVSVFQMAPEWFDRIEFGGVGREPFERESGELFEELANGGSFVHGAVVPNDDDVAAEMFQEVAEEGGDAGGIEGAVDERLEVEVASKGLRRQGQGGEGGDFFAGAGELTENGSNASQRPGAAAKGRELESGFIDQHHMRVRGGPFFTIAGHSVFGQAAMRDSSRWLARLSGFFSEKS